MRGKKRISFFLLLSVSFFIFLIFCTSTSVFAASSDQQIVWQLASWNTSLTVCTLMINSEIQPGEQEILEQCGPEILFEWQTTPPCDHIIENQNCTGLFLRRTGSIVSQNEIPDEKSQDSIGSFPPLRFELVDCLPSQLCQQIPEIQIRMVDSSAFTSFPIKIRIRMGTFEGECESSECRVPLRMTGEQGEWLYYWTMNSNGVQSVHHRVKYRVLPDRSDPTKYHFDLLSRSYPDFIPPGSDLWGLFPASYKPVSKMLIKLDSKDDLITNKPYDILCGKMIWHGLVDTSHCPGFGLMGGESANACGLESCSGKLFEWQNKQNDRFYETGKKYNVPPRLVKGMVAQESQFWPESDIEGEYGLGRITILGIKMLLDWYPAYFNQLCYAIFKMQPNRCGSCFSEMETKDQNVLIGSLIAKTNTVEEIDLITAAVKASASQIEQIILNTSEFPLEEITDYESLWKIAVANYYAGSGCVQRAITSTYLYGYPLIWDTVKNYFGYGCEKAVEYVDRVYSLWE